MASVYRYELGVWGAEFRNVRKLDDLFVDLIRWLFRFPRTTGRDLILADFGHHTCAKRDSLFLASLQLAGAVGTKNSTWSKICGGEGFVPHGS